MMGLACREAHRRLSFFLVSVWVLEHLIRSPASEHRIVERARIIVTAGDGAENPHCLTASVVVQVFRA
jgi:hypothetical protein